MKQVIENPELKALANIILDAETMFIPETVDITLKIIKEKALDFTPDISTKKGQDLVRSQAMTVRKIKTLWIKYGKEKNREEKKSITVRNIELSKIEEFLDDVAVDVRETLTKFEQDEERARAKESGILKDLLYYYGVASDLPVETYENLIKQIKEIEIEGDILSDYFVRATQSKESSLDSLEKKLAGKIQYDKDQAELAVLREKTAKREAKDQKLKDKAKDEKAEKLAENEKAEREEKIRKEEAEKSELAKKELVEKTEREKKEASEKAEADKKKAVEKAQREEKEKADKKERDRLAKERAEKEEAEKLAADKNHRAKIKKDACAALVGLTGDIAMAEAIFDLTSAGNVPCMTVNYRGK